MQSAESDDDALVRRLSARLSQDLTGTPPSTPITPLGRSPFTDPGADDAGEDDEHAGASAGELRALVDGLRAQLEIVRERAEGEAAQAARVVDAALRELRAAKEDYARMRERSSTLEAQLRAVDDAASAQRVEAERRLERERVRREQAEAALHAAREAAKAEQAAKAERGGVSGTPSACAGGSAGRAADRVAALRRLLGLAVLEHGRQSERWRALADAEQPAHTHARGRHASWEQLQRSPVVFTVLDDSAADGACDVAGVEGAGAPAAAGGAGAGVSAVVHQPHRPLADMRL